ncbi:MAG: 5'/3'-nucleotidase SurE [Pirellulaceae bacterium]
MRMLLTNDDGIEAPGDRGAGVALAKFGEVFVVAPHQPCSACGHRIVTERPLAIAQKQAGWTSVDGFPADCVRLGLGYLVPRSIWSSRGSTTEPTSGPTCTSRELSQPFEGGSVSSPGHRALAVPQSAHDDELGSDGGSRSRGDCVAW